MEDRYEIRGKIGHGGLGTVYRGFDLKMKREVAIKRIMTSEDDPSIQEEATKQLAAEAGALASLQHPHIVTVYDVGQDEDGPYVVMELINGKTLDDIIEEHPLMWDDFRELALQSQEALIAAQDLDMIHSDIKPPNIMLTWLPSGKFQVKIVDFGLAVLTQNQSKEEIEQLETVFGSIFFMPPEQFEREVLDARSDLYSMGCVYYQALTGKYPFSGTDGNEVMEAHLNHDVVPIQEIRADVPIWVCDWVMWQINRDRNDRPQSSREALALFLKSSRKANPKMSTGRKAKAGPKLIIPGAEAAGAPGDPEPIYGQPLMPPDITTSVEMMASYEEPEPEPEPQPEAANPVPTQTLGGNSLMHPTQAMGSTTRSVTQNAQTGEPEEGTDQVQISPLGSVQKQGMSAAAKTVIAIVLGIMVVVLGMVLLNRSKQNKENALVTALLQKAADESVTEVPMTTNELELLLSSVAYAGEIEDRASYFNALMKAKSKDGSNYDTAIFKFATEGDLLAKVRDTLLADVIRVRANPDMTPLLIKYAIESNDAAAGVAALKAAYDLGEQSDAAKYLEIITTHAEQPVRTQAERNLGKIIDDTTRRDSLSTKVASAYDKAKDTNTRNAMIRLLGRCSTDAALEQIKKVLNGKDENARLAASTALSEWKDGRAIDVLLDYLEGLADKGLRRKAFEAMIRVGSQDFMLEDEAKAKAAWTKINQQATITEEKIKVINAVTIIDAPWPKPIVTAYLADTNSQVKARAQKAVDYIKDREELKKKEQGGN